MERKKIPEREMGRGEKGKGDWGQIITGSHLTASCHFPSNSPVSLFELVRRVWDAGDREKAGMGSELVLHTEQHQQL